jgi:hypothetical protein
LKIRVILTKDTSRYHVDTLQYNEIHAFRSFLWCAKMDYEHKNSPFSRASARAHEHEKRGKGEKRREEEGGGRRRK